MYEINYLKIVRKGKESNRKKSKESHRCSEDQKT